MATIVIFFGPPNAGKTAQAKRLKDQLGYHYISWGNISTEIENGQGDYKEYQSLVKEINIRNLPFPKGFVTKILKKELEPLAGKKDSKIIIDGYPKRLDEAKELKALMKELQVQLESVVRFNLDFSTYLSRYRKKKGLDKFSDSDLQDHYDTYMSESIDAFNFFAAQTDYIFDVNASDEEPQVFASLVSKLTNKSTYKYHLYTRAAATELQTEFGEFNFTAFQNKVTYDTHLVLSMGEVSNRRHVPLRVHSSCITGDIFHSYRCDCMEQLHYSLKYVSKDNFGIVIYLFQEGRGINIVNKIKAYGLQQIDKRDTVDANTDLGLPPELRKYEAVKDILDELQVVSVDLMTNNPDKISKMQDIGVVIENRIPIVIAPNPHNKHYLETKKNRMNHMLV